MSASFTLRDVRFVPVLLMVSVFGALAFDRHATADDRASVGEWILTSKFDNGEIAKTTLFIYRRSGNYKVRIISRFGRLEVENATVNSGQFQFNAKYEASPQEFRIGFEGEIDGDSIEGRWMTQFGEIPVTGRRRTADDLASEARFVGTWSLNVESAQGSNTRQLVLRSDRTGSYGGNGFPHFAIANIQYDGDLAMMAFTITTDAMELPAKISVNVAGDQLSGTLDYSEGIARIEGTREPPR